MAADEKWGDGGEDDSFRPREDEVFRADQDSFGEAPKKRMGPGTKILLVLLGLGGILFLLCCGGLIYIYSQMEFQQDPAAAIATTREIADMELLEGIQPKGSMRMNVFGIIKFQLAVYELAAADGTLVLAQLQTPMEQADEEDAIRRDLSKQQHGDRELRIKRSETRQFEIGGQKVPFTFAEAEDPKTGAAFRQVSGTFPGKQGTAFLLLQIKEEAYDEDAVVEMIESIK